VGHVFSISYGRLGWIELLTVKAEYRRKGIGTLLMEKTLTYLLSRGVKTIKLEVVPAMSNLYQKLGFTDEYDSLRFMGTSGKFAPLSGHSITPIEKKRFAELARFDAEYFVANRIKV
jgi:ribosomal protein S18 acetylase RimI-like enzyme